MKDLSYITLIDIYGAALTDKQRSILADYYERDFSLSEIADNLKISRQGVHAAIKQAQDSLCEYEQKFGIYSLLLKVNGLINGVKEGNPDNVKTAEELDEAIRSRYGTVR